MAKHSLQEKQSVSAVGVYNAEDCAIEINEKTIEISELLKKFDKTEIKFAVSKVEVIEEE